jgi:hypothetical protein
MIDIETLDKQRYLESIMTEAICQWLSVSIELSARYINGDTAYLENVTLTS